MICDHSTTWRCSICYRPCPNGKCECWCTHKCDHEPCRIKQRQILQQQQQIRDEHRHQQQQIEQVKSQIKSREEELMREVSSLTSYSQKKRADRTAYQFALQKKLTSREQALRLQSSSNEAKVQYQKFVSNLEMKVTLRKSVEEVIATSSTSKQSADHSHSRLETPSDQPLEECSLFTDGKPAPSVLPAAPMNVYPSPPSSVSHYNQLPSFCSSSNNGVPRFDLKKDSPLPSQKLENDYDLSNLSSRSLEDLSHLDSTTEPIPLPKAASLDNLFNAYCLQESLLYSSVPITRLFTYYKFHLSPKEYLIFLRDIGDPIQEAAPFVQESFISYLFNGGNLYSDIVKNYPCSEWLLHSLVQELIHDTTGKTNPIDLQRFQKLWTDICKEHRGDKVKLLHALWDAKKEADLPPRQIIHTLEMLLATGVAGYDIVCSEEKDKLNQLKHLWLLNQLHGLPKLASSISACSNVTGVLSRSHLSPSTTSKILATVREEDDASSLLKFLDLIVKRKVPEFLVLSTIHERNAALNNFENRIHQWLTSLLCELSMMHLSKISCDASDSIFPILFSRIKGDPTIAPALEEFIYTNHESIAEYPATFVELLEVIHNYQVQEEITTSVLKDLEGKAFSEWILQADKLIVKKLFRSGSPYSVRELIKMIVGVGPAAGLCHSPSLHDSVKSSSKLQKTAMEEVMQEVVERLKPTIKEQLKSVKDTYEKKLEELVNNETLLKEEVENVTRQRSVLTSGYNEQRKSYERSSASLNAERKKLEIELDKLEKENEENLKKSEQAVKKSEYLLGEKARTNPSETQSGQTMLEEIRDKLYSVVTKISEEEIAFIRERNSYEDSSAVLSNKIKSLEGDILETELKQRPIRLKLKDLSRENATNFSDRDLYKEVLDSFDKSVSISSISGNQSLHGCSQSELVSWSKRIKSKRPNVFNSFSVTEIISGINIAATLSNNAPLTKEQYHDLLETLFPFCPRSNPYDMKDPLVLIFLAAICAFQNEQVSLVTDSEKWPISESDISSHLPLFELLNLTVTKRDNVNPSSSLKSEIVYGKNSDFSPIQLLVDYTGLHKKIGKIDIRYNSPSCIMNSTGSASLSGFEDDPICTWNKEIVHLWAEYVQQNIFNLDCIDEESILIELITVVQRVAELVQGISLESEQRYALLSQLYPTLDGCQLLQKDPKDGLVFAMCAAIHSLQAKKSYILPYTKLDFTPYQPLFDMLYLNVSHESCATPSDHSCTISQVLIHSGGVKGSDSSFTSLSHEQIYNIVRIVYPDLYAEHNLRLDMIETPTSSLSSVKSAIREHIKRDAWQPFTSLMQLNGTHWVTLSIIRQRPSLAYHAYYANFVDSKDHDCTIESSLFDSGISNIHKLHVSLQHDENSSGVYAIATANAIAKAIKFNLTHELPTCLIKVTPEEIYDLRQRWDSSKGVIENSSPIEVPENEKIPQSSQGSVSIDRSAERQEQTEESRDCTPESSDSSSENEIETPITSDSNASTRNQEESINSARSTTTCAGSTNEDSSTFPTACKQLEELYNSIQECYESPSRILQDTSLQFKDKPISEWTGDHLKDWADYVQSKNYSGQVIELIAGVYHAVLLHHPFCPRSTQLFALLSLLYPSHDKGRLVQVNTGEGKSLIVAMFAAVHALQGRKVDVVTTSTELSIPEVEKQKPFFERLNLSVSENSPSRNKVDVYKCQIVYGTASDFLADILRQFLGENTRGDRNMEIVMVDEVDSLLFDNRTQSVRLSHGNPGMDHLKLPLSSAWHYTHWLTDRMFRCDGKVYFSLDGTSTLEVDDERLFITERTETYLADLLRTLDPTEKEEYKVHFAKRCKIAEVELDMKEMEETNSQRPKKIALHEQLKKELEALPWSNRSPILDIPEHLREHSQIQLSGWINHCLNARYNYKKEYHYTVSTKGKIVPVQYNETGVLQHDLVWSDGLCQFLQIKEGLSVDPESISSNALSKPGFFKRYGNSIYGLTGTLGGPATRSFLEEFYNVDFVVIPPHKSMKIQDNSHTPYLCKELRPITVKEKDYFPAILYHALYHAKQGRAALVISKFREQAKYLEQQLKEQYDKDKVFAYIGDDTRFQKDVVKMGEIILATNIAGRGTDLITTDEVEENGGMYVAITFLPESERVELQNAGRTARAGKKGMAQLILCLPEGMSLEEMVEKRRSGEALTTQHALPEAKKRLIMDALLEHYCKVVSKYLPSASDCDAMDQAATVLSEWNKVLRSEFTDDAIDEQFQKWVNESKTKWIVRNCSVDQKGIHDAVLDNQLDEHLLSKRNAFKSAYRNKLFEKFHSNYPRLPSSLLSCLKSGEPFKSNRSALAEKYDWGRFEQKAVDERWGIWLKQKHFEEDDSPESPLSIFETFDKSFALQLSEDAKADRLIKNPYYYILKGNSLLSKGTLGGNESHFSDAIKYYNRSIDLDPNFSLQSRYNKARALLSFKKNKGYCQREAYKELKLAENLISTIYRPNIMAFQGFLCHGKAKTNTVKAIQHDLHVLSQQEKYIHQALEVLEDSGATREKKQANVKLTSKPLNSTFKDPRTAVQYGESIREVGSKGLTDLFTVTKIPPFPLLSIICMGLISLGQIALGCLLTAYGGVHLGMAFIRSGIDDMVTGIKAAFNGKLDWAAWAIQKGVEILTSLASHGMKLAKEAMTNVKGAGQSLRTGVQSTKQAIKNMCTGKQLKSIGVLNLKNEIVYKTPKQIVKDTLAVQLKQRATSELLGKVAEHAAEELWVKKQAAKIRRVVREELTKAIESNELIIRALKLDTDSENSFWQQCFLREAGKILKNMRESDKESDQKGQSWHRRVLKGTMNNTVPLSREIELGIDGFQAITKSFSDDSNTIAPRVKEFVGAFNERLITYKIDIENSKQSHEEMKETISNSDRTTVIVEPPPVDLNNEDITLHEVDHISDFQIKNETEDQIRLEEEFPNLGPSTPESLVSQIEEYICSATIQELTNQIMPMASYGSHLFAEKLFRKANKQTNKFLNALETRAVFEHRVDEFRGRQKKRAQKEGGEVPNEQSNGEKKPEDQPSPNIATEQNEASPGGKKEKEGRSSANQSKDKRKRERQSNPNPHTEKSAREAQGGEPLTVAHLEILSQLFERPIFLFDENGELLREPIGDWKSGDPIEINISNNQEGGLAHAKPLNLTPEQEKLYESLDQTGNDCILNSLFVNLPEETRKKLKDVNGMRENLAYVMSNDPKLYEELFKAQEDLRLLAPAEVPRIGIWSQFSEENYQENSARIISIKQILATDKTITPEEKENYETELAWSEVENEEIIREANIKDIATVGEVLGEFAFMLLPSGLRKASSSLKRHARLIAKSPKFIKLVKTADRWAKNVCKVQQKRAQSKFNTIPENVSNHALNRRNASGHWHTRSAHSRRRIEKLVLNVANDPKNVCEAVLSNAQKTMGNCVGYAKTFRNGSQVWVQTRNGVVINFGVNKCPK